MLTAVPDTAPAPGETARTTPRLVISTACLSGTLEDKLRAAASAGFHGLEMHESDLVMSPWSPRRVRQEAAELGLSVDVYQPFPVDAVPPARFGASLRRAERKFDVLAELGAGTMLACAGSSPGGVDDDDLAAEQLHALADRAERRGLRIAYEAVPWERVGSLDHAWLIVQRAGHRSLGLCLDSFHLLAGGDDLDHIGRMSGATVFHVQLADAPRTHLDPRNVRDVRDFGDFRGRRGFRDLRDFRDLTDLREWSQHHRRFPGQGSLDLAGFVGQVLATGYTGPMALEVCNDSYQQADPWHAATDAMRSMLALTEAVSTGGPALARAYLPATLPPAPRLRGFAFVELAVDEGSGPLLARTLGALGFTHAGQHRSKPVQLWQQGSARILLNLAPHRSIEPTTAAVCALGVASSDPAGSAGRAERLLAPKLPRARRPDEADLSSVAAPDGTAVFFCHTGPDPGWLDDFTPTGVPQGSTLLSGVDHVSLTESVDDFDQVALFYRSVLGLHPGDSTETTAPFGLLRTWSVTDPDQHVRITLNTAPLRHGDWAPAVPKPQHIAFATGDAIACARAMHELHAPLLEIPGNYYDDLDARLALPPALLAAMREHSVLYDRDEHGEYLHFCTELLGSRVFFEFVQRIGGYARYGDPGTAPLRMAAHRRQRLRMLATPRPARRGEDRNDYSLAHLTALSLSPPELVDAAAAAGYRYVGLRMTKVTAQEPHYPLASDPALMRATKTHLAATGIEVLDVELARMAARDNPREYLRFLEAGAELGARHVITQLPDADFLGKTGRFAQLCELARPLGLTIDLEFPSWTETPDLTEAVRVLRAAGQPNAGILVDLLHFARSGSRVAELRELPAEWFHFVHVCDAPAEIPVTTEGLIHTARFERMFPGEGGIDMHGILAALPSGLPYALEIPRATLVAQVGGKEHARLAISAARRHLDAVRTRTGRAGSGGQARAA